MEKLSKERIDKTCQLALADADTREENAGYSGAMNDGGASVIRSYVEIWKAGLSEQIPKALKNYYDEIVCEEDPEWKEYKRLKAKFRDREGR